MLLHIPLFCFFISESIDEINDHVFDLLIIGLDLKGGKFEIKVEIKIKCPLDTVKNIKADESCCYHQAENKTEDGDDHGPFGGAGGFDTFASCPRNDAEKGKENAEEGGIAAKNGDDGHDSCHQRCKG